jgi:hypothetical protein
MKTVLKIGILVGVLGYALPLVAATVHVPADQPTIQAGIDAAQPGDTVLVADGIYKGIGNRNIDFKGKRITVRSANGPKNCIIDCENQGGGFYLHSSEGNDSVISGFTITGGYSADGGGIYGIDSSPTISRCIIRGNSSYTVGDYYGGGICLKTTYSTSLIKPVITNCVISGNKSGRRGGGGIYLSSAAAIITNCTIVGNSTNLEWGYPGGGIEGGNATITNCIIRGNAPNQINGGGTCSYSNIEGGRLGQGNIDVNAAFADPAINDFRLLDYSPCIGSGTSTGALAVDITGNPRPSPAASYPDMGAYESPFAIRTAPALDIFGMAAGNVWVYEGTKEGNPYTVERKVTMDTSAFPIATYAHEIKENGVFSGREYYQKSSDQVLLWGASIKDAGSLYDLKFSKGLPVIRFPVVVGDHQYSSTTGVFTQFPGYTFNVSMDVLVMGQETVDLGFDTFEAYKVRYEMRVWGQGVDYTDTFFWWVVPYIGAVKDEDADSMVKLTSFAIGEGTITHQSDADRDGLRDYQELFKGPTNWLDGDTDDDGCLDGPELQGGRNPLIADPEGDVNGDCALNLSDAIFVLSLMAGIEPSGTVHKEGDVNGDGKVGSEEVIWIIQKMSGLR